MVWQAAKGYSTGIMISDETILFLEGSIVLENASMPTTRYGPGDVVFFKNGAHAIWHVKGHVRKLAFFPQKPAVSPRLRAAGLLQDQENPVPDAGPSPLSDGS